MVLRTSEDAPIGLMFELKSKIYEFGCLIEKGPPCSTGLCAKMLGFDFII